MDNKKRAKVIHLNGRSGKTMNRIEFVIFGAILVYIVAMISIYYHSTPIVGYEIKMGSLSVSKAFTGIALRQEEVISSPYNGYINFYMREGERVSTRDKLYSIDETGKLADLLSSMQLENTTYSDRDLDELKQEIMSFDKDFETSNFQRLYDFKYDFHGSVIKLSNDAMFQSMEKINQTNLNGMVNLCATGKTGYAVFYLDGYESTALEDINQSMFDQSKYEKNRIENNQLVEKEQPVCKIITDEEWKLVVPLNDKNESLFLADDYMKVKFTKNQQTSWAYVTILNQPDGKYAVLTFNNSCITFCTERFVEIELILNDVQGLKIPNSSIVEKEFMIIPKDYVTRGGEHGNYGVSKEYLDENGNTSYKFTDVTIYSELEDSYYVDGAGLERGDFIYMPDSMDKYRLTEFGTLIGVYNMNKGFADFKQITILYQNDEYAIINSNTNYGLTVYDRIVLDASTVNNNDFTN